VRGGPGNPPFRAISDLLARFPLSRTDRRVTNPNTPAAWLTIPKHFGRRPDVVFLTPSDSGQKAASDAARIQHAAALGVLDELARLNKPLSYLADALDENVDHLRRKMYGQVQASLRDLCSWADALGVPTVTTADNTTAVAR
jgi:hypothetical protein